MDADIQTAIIAFCTPENLARVVQTEASRVLDMVIKDEINKFFSYGDGRKAVAASIKETILKKETYTILDEVEAITAISVTGAAVSSQRPSPRES